MHPSRLPLVVPVTPAALADARALIADADTAAAAPESLRRLAWRVYASSLGRTIPQRRRPDGVA